MLALRLRAFLAFTLAMSLLLLAWPHPSVAAVSILRAELKGSDLRLEGDRAVPAAPILVDGIERGRADTDGRFRIEVRNFSSPTCRISVDDGTGAVAVSLQGCTPTQEAPAVAMVGLNPASITGGTPSAGTVTLSAAAPTGGAVVALASSNAAVATVPPSVTISAGQTSATFTVTTQTVAASHAVTISATYGGATRTAALTVAPSWQSGGILAALTISPDTVTGGESSQGTATLTGSVATDTLVTLSSTDTTVATVPPSVTVPAGASSAIFTITTQPVSGTGTFSWISGAAGGQTWGASINVNPGAPASAPTVEAVTFAPSTVGGGGASTGTVTLSGAATDGAIIALSSSHPDLVQVPAEVVVPANAASRAFSVTTQVVPANVEVTITATANCCGATGTRAGTITVTTAPPPTPDTVRITKVQWKRCIFTIEATSTNPNAILTVHLTSSGSEILRLSHLGGGNYAGERVWRAPGTNVPVDITLKSTFGGSDAATVSDPEAGRCKADL